jgi:hypothetical protein
MKLVIGGFAAIALAVLSLSIPAPFFSSEASANRMNGKGNGCSSGMNCMPERYQAAMKKKNQAPKKRN